ncbi:ABC transporter permease [Tessaracoccus lapidicaptus]|uniref:Xylose transport system permease protein XylH n=1 Tax=Tessaracoccus lapidicaptus TaxID=1427523 RepID=A0A1C0AKU2_9ACTN|nr:MULTISPECIES: multiple monosaccharide ABC transporter permease [Tessaracoccus]AQX15983.1 ABC transporter permease [Tessaracoccus sp. T2.5-30]OCL33284.1 ABC transporter permease [Tessaracoccus lapidicaptus]VEP40483.1 Xylose transport system permease protein XylH [Tessaracoccus lapidicaptus]
MATVKDLFSKNLRQSGIVIAFVAIVLLFTVLTGGTLLNPTNVSNLILQYSYILILAIGMLFVIVVGHIDLSVGSVVALVGAVSATLIIKQGMPWYVGVIAGLLVGLAIGAWHGFWVAYVGIPGFIVTLSGMLLFRGMTFLVLGSVSLSPMTSEYQQIANGFLNGLLGGYGYDLFTLLIGVFAVAGFAWTQWRSRRARIRYEQEVEGLALFVAKLAAVAVVVMFFAWKLATARGFPIVLIVLAVLIITYSFLAKNSIYGRHVYAIGGNINAAMLSGVKVKRTIFWVYVHMGLLTGIAGVVFSSRTNGAQPAAGNMFELDAIAACFIGGAAVTGGVGTVIGAMIGGLVMAVMSNGMQLMGVQTSIQQIVKGLVLLLAVAFDIWNKRRAAAAKA